MLKGFLLRLGALSLVLLALPAYSSSVSLVPNAAQVQQGETFLVDLVLNTDGPGNLPGSFGGRVIVSVATSAARYTDFDIIAPAVLTFGPDLDTSDGDDNVELWFEKAENIGVIGTFSFLAVGDPGTTIDISVTDALEFASSFFNADPTNQTFDPDEFNGTSLVVEPAAVPLPAAAWLMLSGLGFIGIATRRKRA